MKVYSLLSTSGTILAFRKTSSNMKKIYTLLFIISLCAYGNTAYAGTNLICNATAIASPTVICTGQSAMLSGALSGPGAGSGSYTWLPMNTPGQSITVSPTAPTTYTLQVVAGTDTCYRAVTVNVLTCAGVEEFAAEDVKIYPSPASNEINILFEKNTAIINTEVKLINELGEIVYSTSENKIDVSKLPRGLYFVNVRINEKYITSKKILLL